MGLRARKVEVDAILGHKRPRSVRDISGSNPSSFPGFQKRAPV